MSQDPNPFEVSPSSADPNEARIQGSSGDSMEQIRKDHLSHEASIQGMGTLYVLGGAFGVLAGVLYLGLGISALLAPAQQQQGGAVFAGIIFLGASVFVGAIGVFQFWTGLALRKLKPAARIPGIVLSAIGMMAIPIGTIISGYFLYLVVSQKGNYILSPQYADVIRQTPHIKYKTSIIVWIFLGLLLLLIGIGVLSLIFS